MELEFYDGASTGQQIDETVQKGIIAINCGTISSLPYTKNNANILANHVVIGWTLGTPSAQKGDWTWEIASAGSITISGSISGSTTLVLYLGRVGQTI